MSIWRQSPLVVGHRGGRGEGWPLENTLDAFEQARAHGARAIELDVRTFEGRVIVQHDTPGRGATLDPRVPDLRAVLDWARGHDVAVNVEMKHDVASRAELASKTVDIVRASRADVLLSSFDPALLVMAAARAAAVPRALLAHAAQPRWASVVQEGLRPPLVEAIHLERTQTDPRLVRRYLRRGLRVGVWTVNDPREAADLVSLGVASVITDAPGVILAVLGEAHARR